MKHRIMIVEDDLAISDMVHESLAKEGYEVIVAYDGEEALQLFDSQRIDLILLDLMLPKMAGMECLKVIRAKSMVPILIMSAKGEDVDKALGLGFGADDYLSKPFSLIELKARVQAILRRQIHYTSAKYSGAADREEIIKVGDLVIDLNSYSVRKADKELNLTAKEFNILKLFMAKPNHVYTKSHLYQRVWQEEYYGDENVINVHIRRLREKIEDNPSAPKYIKTVWGIGYKLGEV
ncbi:response regulator transcription factor [Ureibacillus sinduriensis]|uniref:PhoP family transcriptional regulator n=1 Tax=Ureibacillus sinduriensis BLB-1 = JCM 15800 TaxID=1384057 RepID=A0A0A3HRB8_9BACL|nr:response regulator transcription factor [Ureibacillus sinduriensis]KGR75156.1 PhoP family transcriptional regulator [Ureibacillus sinduriensis BLB-1 = JCM 15800]